jgi:hypothetical protein
MTLPEDRPDIGEKYSRATESSHLEVTPDRFGDVDMLIASGWTSDGLGARLYRLRMEWDFLNQRELAAASLSTAHAISMNRLKSLRSTMDALMVFALQHAARTRITAGDREVRLIAARALDMWICPNCKHCTGRGFTGGFGVPMVLCTACAGTGKRPLRLGSVESTNRFGLSLMGVMDRKTETFTAQMREFLRYRSRHAVGRDEAGRDIEQRLKTLRSTEAQED